MMKFKELSKPRNIAVVALLIAANIAVSMVSTHTETIKISLSFLPVAFAAYFFGPVAAALVGGAGDIVSAIVFPVGPYFPGFTLTAVLTGICFGLFLYQKTETKNMIYGAVKIIVCVLINELIGSLLLNTMWISILYSIPFKPLIVSRFLTQIIVMIPIEFVVLWLIFGKSMVAEQIKKAVISRKK